MWSQFEWENKIPVKCSKPTSAALSRALRPHAKPAGMPHHPTTDTTSHSSIRAAPPRRPIADFLQQLAINANMSLLAYGNPLRGSCNYASANLYARSIFGPLEPAPLPFPPPPPLFSQPFVHPTILRGHLTPSLAGEDVLLHVSVEQDPSTGRLVGFCRIRSKQQGIALALGDKIALSMA